MAKTPLTPNPRISVIGHAGTAPIIVMQITAKSSTADSKIKPSTRRERAWAETANGNQGSCREREGRPLSPASETLATSVARRIVGREVEENSSSAASPL